MDTGSWPKYTITAMLGVIVGISSVFGNITITSQSRVAALEVRALEAAEAMRRIESKIDKLHEGRIKPHAQIP